MGDILEICLSRWSVYSIIVAITVALGHVAQTRSHFVWRKAPCVVQSMPSVLEDPGMVSFGALSTLLANPLLSMISINSERQNSQLLRSFPPASSFLNYFD